MVSEKQPGANASKLLIPGQTQEISFETYVLAQGLQAVVMQLQRIIEILQPEQTVENGEKDETPDQANPSDAHIR